MKGKKLSLSERIALAATGAQEEEYPEDIEYETSAKVVDIDEEDDDNPADVRPPRRSSLRTKNVQLLDQLDTRYAGAKVSRKKLDGVGGHGGKKYVTSNKDIDMGTFSAGSDGLGDSSEGGDDSDEDDGSEAFENAVEGEDQIISDDSGQVLDSEEDEDDDEEVDGGDDSDEVDSEEKEEGDEVNSENEDEEETAGVRTLSLRDKETEIEKGKDTLNQIRIWDSLLEVRIRLQKMLLDCNRLPTAGDFDVLTNEIKTATDGSGGLLKSMEKSQEATKVLMHELLRLQGILVNQNSETRNATDSKMKTTEDTNDDPMNEEITSEEDDISNDDDQPTPTPPRKRKNIPMLLDNAKKLKPEEFLLSSEKAFMSFKPYRNQTIQKWNDKTQFAVGKFNRKTTSHQISTLKQIEQILSNKDRLVKRTQVKRSKYSLIGSKAPEKQGTAEENQELDPEIFDDDDFYHQLLRELIERKTANVNDPVQLSHHWLELQKLRTKLKKKVDTKASKGRKIRYDVHSKLVNFMAPHDNCTMSSAAVKELFGSLFGKTKE